MKPVVDMRRNTAPSPEEAQVREMAVAIRPLAEGAMALEIATPTDFVVAGDDLKRVKTRMNEADALRRSLTKPLDEAKKRIMDLFRPVDTQLKAAEAALKGAMLDYQGAERRRLAEEEDAAWEVRRKEMDRLEKLADAARAKGKTAKAEALAVIAEATPEVETVAPTQVAGIQTRTIWRAEVEDMTAYVQWVIENAHGMALDQQFLLPNMDKLNAVARAGKGSMTVPGVRMVSTEVMAAGRA
jgi:hypothetical protein